MEKYFEVLSQCPLFFGIQREELGKMLPCLGCKIDFYDKKFTVFAEGHPARHLGILLSGKAQTVRFDYNGNRSILSEILPGDVFGEAFACSQTPSLPISIVAEEPSTVMLIECERILKTCTNQCRFHQSLIFNLMKDLAEKTVRFYQKSEIISQRTTREKLLTYLSIQSAKAKSRRFSIPFDRQELADYLEVDRSGLSGEISKLKREGIFLCRKNEFELL